MITPERPIDAAMVEDIREARSDAHRQRHQLFVERQKRVELWDVFAWIVSIMIPVMNDWPWYQDLAVFVAIFTVAHFARGRVLGLSTKDIEYPSERSYERYY